MYHSSLTLSQSIVLERLQAKALKAIYGYEPSYRELVEKSNLTTLRKRRDDRELAFAAKAAGSVRFNHWFPRHEAVRQVRNSPLYWEEYARCCRCYNSPIYSIRRRLNREGSGGEAREAGAA